MQSNLPLAGLTVIELGDSAAAPFCGQILGDLGADVIKIERPDGGDPARAFGKADWHGHTATFAALNRNKRSVVVDLKNPDELSRFKTLIADRADIFFHNLRPGTAQNFGLDGEALLKASPRLIYCTLGAFGRKGPLSRSPGYDPLMQAFGGIMSVTGEAGRPPVRVGVPIIDLSTGMWSVIGILAAVNRRHATGQGGIVDTSLYEAAVSWMTLLSATNFATGEVPRPLGSGTVITAPYRAYETADGYLVVACANNRLFAKLSNVLGCPEWPNDERLATAASRVANRELIDGLIGDILIREPRRVWQERLDAVGVPNAPLQDMTEVHGHEQTAALGMIMPTEFADMKLVALPLSFEDSRSGIRRLPPKLGEHTEEVFKK